MDDPKRLVHEEGASGELLGAWRTRQPSDASRARTLAALGVAGAATGVAAKAGASVAPKAAVASLSLKWIAIGVALLAAIGAVVYVATRSTASPSVGTLAKPSPTVVAPITLPTSTPTHVDAPVQTRALEPVAPSIVAPSIVAQSPAPPVLDPAPPSSSSRADSPTVTSPGSSASRASATVASTPTTVSPATTASTPKATAPAAPSASSLDEEVVAIDAARHAVTSGDAAGALAMANAYDARFPNGALAQESAEIRIEALFRLGRRAEGERLADRFLASHPTSPYARVVRGLLAGSPPAPR